MIGKAQQLVVAALLSASIALPRDARAQLNQFRLGGNLGYVYDEETDFIYLSAEARATLTTIPIEFAPRFSYQPVSGSGVVQIDLNVLYDLPLAKTSAVLPYAGIGFAYQTISHGGGSAAGYNIVLGVELTHVPVVQPYAQFEYSVLENHFPNQGAIAVGALFRFKT
ncbi:MAG TPA: hypothetical protein VFA43_23490 [Gemmatimonadaceae bacterium]|nr:hypothetical protein [Gemmatimonadaceae bacterium]